MEFRNNNELNTVVSGHPQSKWYTTAGDFMRKRVAVVIVAKWSKSHKIWHTHDNNYCCLYLSFLDPWYLENRNFYLKYCLHLNKKIEDQTNYLFYMKIEYVVLRFGFSFSLISVQSIHQNQKSRNRIITENYKNFRWSVEFLAVQFAINFLLLVIPLAELFHLFISHMQYWIFILSLKPTNFKID